MSNLARLKKLELAANEHRRQKRQKSKIDYSLLSDEELNSLYQKGLAEIDAMDNSKYAGMTDQQLSDLYMETIKAGNLKYS